MSHRARAAFADLDILAVDDNAGMRALLERVLTAAGATVRSAASGAEALAHMEERVAHIVLCDQTMPSMSGIELTRRLRAAYGADPVIVILSGHNDVADARAAGVDDLLMKPISPRFLLERIEALLSARARPAA